MKKYGGTGTGVGGAAIVFDHKAKGVFLRMIGHVFARVVGSSKHQPVVTGGGGMMDAIMLGGQPYHGQRGTRSLSGKKAVIYGKISQGCFSVPFLFVPGCPVCAAKSPSGYMVHLNQTAIAKNSYLNGLQKKSLP